MQYYASFDAAHWGDNLLKESFAHHGYASQCEGRTGNRSCGLWPEGLEQRGRPRVQTVQKAPAVNGVAGGQRRLPTGRCAERPGQAQKKRGAGPPM